MRRSVILIALLRRLAVLGVVTQTLWFSPVFARKPSPGLNADSIHWAAWDSVLEMADHVPAVQYAFYAYHTLAVPKPEIYLKSDALFSDIVGSIPGSQAALDDRDPRNLALYRRLQRGEQKGPPFTWAQWFFTPASVHDSMPAAGGVSWLDRRLPSAAVLLRCASPGLSSVEASALLYTQLRQIGRPDTSLFVIVDTAGRGFLADGSDIISPKTALPWEGDPKTIVPVLVFNERVALYPLFERDDRPADTALGCVVAKLGSPALPHLTLLDRIRLQKLRVAAVLPTQRSQDLAVIAACGAVGMYNPKLAEAWVACTGDTLGVSGREKSTVRSTLYWADRLSRSAAEVAALGDSGTFASSAARWEKRYLKLCGRMATVDGRVTNPDRFEAWGGLWARGLIDISFDDIIRTRAGPGSSQALAMSAILGILGHPYFRLEIDPGGAAIPDQNWVIAEQGKWQFNLGAWTPVQDTLPTQRRLPLLMLSYGIGGSCVTFDSTGIDGDVDALMLASDLTEMTRTLRNSILHVPGMGGLTEPLGEVMMRFDNNQVSLRPLPWPDLNSPGGQVR